MAVQYKTQGFVFKKIDLNESDRVFSVFTKDYGRVELFGKAIRKSVSKLRSGIDSFFLSDVEFIQGKNKKTLTDSVCIERHSNISYNLEKFKIANKINDIVDGFIKGQEKDSRIFELLKDIFYELNNFRNNTLVKVIFYYFVWNFLSIIGYKPEVEKCGVCHEKLNPYYIYFSLKVGGILCKKCAKQNFKNIKINSDIVKILRLILNKEWNILSKLKIGINSMKLFDDVTKKYYLHILSDYSFKNDIIKT
jgi:DNA repair protein RecO (recombination protein O)